LVLTSGGFRIVSDTLVYTIDFNSIAERMLNMRVKWSFDQTNFVSSSLKETLVKLLMQQYDLLFKKNI